MFGWEFPPFNSGGLGTACLGLTRALSGYDTKVYFVLPKKVDIVSSDVSLLYADEYLPNVSLKIINSLLKPYIDSSQYKSLRDKIGAGIYGLNLLEEVKLYALRARELAENLDFDVIHAHDWLSFGAGIEAKRVSHKPLVVHVHATEFDRTGGSSINKEVYEMEKMGMEAADTVITVSNFTRRIVIDKYGIFPGKVVVVHNGIDEYPDNYDFSKEVQALKEIKDSGKKVVLFVGRITLQKGPDYFLRAARTVLDYYPDVHFVMAGSGDMQNQIIRQAVDLGISDKITFAGFLRGRELDEIYKAADLYVMPSVSEPFGITALEAVRNGTPVLISKQSGASEVIKNAIKVDFWDVEEMANDIVCALFHRSLRETLRENAWSELSNVTWRKAAEKCVSIYKNLVSTPIIRN